MKVVVSAQVEREDALELARRAAQDDRTVSQLVRYAIGEYLERAAPDPASTTEPAEKENDA